MRANLVFLGVIASSSNLQGWKNSARYSIQKLKLIKELLWEIILASFFKQNNLPFTYVGDGQMIIGGKCPDFVCNPLKLVIEVGNKREKSFERKGRNWKGWKDYTRKRKAHFKRYFFDCLCLWKDELKYPLKLQKKILNFLKAEEYLPIVRGYRR